MGLMKNFFSQTRKPESLLGKVMLNGMNPGHAKLADWGFAHLPKLAPERALDIGCGGGRNAGELLRMYPMAHVTAIDYSELSVAKARDYNRDMIAAGRCDVRQGDAASLAFPDASFDLATAFETVYFWPGFMPFSITFPSNPSGFRVWLKKFFISPIVTRSFLRSNTPARA